MRHALSWLCVILAAGIVLAIATGLVRSEVVDGAEIRVVDGDTVALIGGPRMRLLNIDAGEVRSYGRSGPSCENEKQLGIRATRRLKDLIASQPVNIVRSGQFDRYGRELIRLESAVGDLGQILVAEGLALPWRDGAAERAKRIATWCGRSR